MKKYLLFFIFFIIIASSCSQNFNSNSKENVNKAAKEALNTLYFENDKISGFKNEDNNKVDSFTTYRAVMVNDFFGKNVYVNEEKLKIFVLAKLKDMTIKDRITRDLMEEKNTIELVDYFKIKLTGDLKQKIISALDSHILEETNKIPKGDQSLVNINRQFKTQIHYNYLFIAKKIGYSNISPKIKETIISNYRIVERNLSDTEKNSIKAIYYSYMLQKYLAFPIKEETKIEILNKIKKLSLPDHGYTFLPSNQEGSPKVESDIFSTRLAVEVLCDIKTNFVYNEQDKKMLKSFLLELFKKSKISNKTSISIVELYEIVNLSKFIGFENSNNLYKE